MNYDNDAVHAAESSSRLVASSSGSSGLPSSSSQSTPNIALNDDDALVAQPKWKGKGKEVDIPEQDELYGGTRQDTRSPESESSGAGVYPPMHDEEIEERRVIETLKRWEEADRLRRKALRDSNSHSAHASVASVGSRASELWRRTSTRRSMMRGAVPLRDSIDSESSHPHSNNRTSLAALPASPTSSTPFNKAGPSNPFEPQPNESPFDDPGPSDTVLQPLAKAGNGPFMDPASPPLTPGRPSISGNDDTRPPVLRLSSAYVSERQSEDASKSYRQSTLPPPAHLDLPEAVTPPPARVLTPTYERSDAQQEQDLQVEERERHEGRWWTDWFCGCRERGHLGDGQAGRTNPFE